MNSKAASESAINDAVVILPPVICNNHRERIEAEQIDPSAIKNKSKEIIRSDGNLVENSTKKPLLPIPKFPLELVWDPGHLYYEINEDPIVSTLSICNVCPRTIYIHCCGFWGETARLGASWSCHPLTRFHLAPGMVSRLNITATPRDQSPVPLAYAGLQLAAAHLRDNVVGFFFVPIQVKFMNFRPPSIVEESSEINA